MTSYCVHWEGRGSKMQLNVEKPMSRLYLVKAILKKGRPWLHSGLNKFLSNIFCRTISVGTIFVKQNCRTIFVRQFVSKKFCRTISVKIFLSNFSTPRTLTKKKFEFQSLKKGGFTLFVSSLKWVENDILKNCRDRVTLSYSIEYPILPYLNSIDFYPYPIDFLDLP